MGLNNGNFRVEILPFLRVRRWNDRLWNVWDGIMKEFCLKDVIECFHSCGQHLWKFFWNKRKRLHKKRVQLPQDLFGTPTWPPFYCFATPIWPPWRHVKTLPINLYSASNKASRSLLKVSWYVLFRGVPRCTLLNSWWRFCLPVPQTLTLLHTKLEM